MFERLSTSDTERYYTKLCPGFQLLVAFLCCAHIRQSIVRYALPPAFLASVLSPAVKSEKKVRSILERMCYSYNSLYWKSEEDGGAAMAGLAGDSETHPYVSFTMNLA